MNSHTLLPYVLKSIFISGVFMGYYWIALRNKSFNNYNRFYLLLSMACSLLLPLFNFSWFTIAQQELPIAHETFSFISTQIVTDSPSTFSWPAAIVYVASGISLFLTALFAFNIMKVYRLKRRSAIMKMDGINFINTNLENAPFSFLNNLFWKESIPLDEEFGQKIFKHELTHIHQKHTLDIIFCQLINAVLWMNPFNWLIQKELKAIHEFIADKASVSNNDVEEFVKLLLQAHYGKHFLDPTHAFYYSSIKRRLFMLTTTNKTTFSHVRKFLVLPVTLAVVATLSVSMIESKANALVAPIITLQQAAIPAPVQQPDVPAPVKQPKVAIPVRAQQPEKPVTKKDTVPAEITVIGYGSKTKKDTASQNKVVTMRADAIVLRLSNPDSTKNASMPNVLYYIDNQFGTSDDVGKLKPEQIKYISVWKGDAAIKKFGDKGANGVIEVFTR
jgi:hypothetical protein